MNAGAIPSDHWTQDVAVGGGRIIGEACHLIDLARFLVGSKITEVRATAMGGNVVKTVTSDKAHITLRFEDGSTAVVHYLANGSSSYPKERVEVFCGGAIAVIDNYVATKSYGAAGLKSVRHWRQDKGQVACATAFAQAVSAGGASPIPYAELVEVARACFDAQDQIAEAG
jgi:predicted dehydrogenase